jgi:hypothetical protein
MIFGGASYQVAPFKHSGKVYPLAVKKVGNLSEQNKNLNVNIRKA